MLQRNKQTKFRMASLGLGLALCVGTMQLQAADRDDVVAGVLIGAALGYAISDHDPGHVKHGVAVHYSGGHDHRLANKHRWRERIHARHDRRHHYRHHKAHRRYEKLRYKHRWCDHHDYHHRHKGKSHRYH